MQSGVRSHVNYSFCSSIKSHNVTYSWGGIGHFDPRSTFLGRLETLTKLQRFRHFRTLTLEVVIVDPSCINFNADFSSEVMEQNPVAGELFLALSNWSTGIISDRASYFKIITWPQDDSLAYYCVIRVINFSNVSRLCTL
jgi:hypothetical protein